MILSSNIIATALSGLGLIITAPMVDASAALGAFAASCVAARKRFTRKMVKHENTVTLAQSKLNSVSELVSKALTDGEISDEEFTLIVREIDKYRGMKALLRQRNTALPSRQHGADSERDRLKRELRKKLGSLAELN